MYAKASSKGCNRCECAILSSKNKVSRLRKGRKANAPDQEQGRSSEERLGARSPLVFLCFTQSINVFVVFGTGLALQPPPHLATDAHVRSRSLHGCLRGRKGALRGKSRETTLKKKRESERKCEDEKAAACGSPVSSKKHEERPSQGETCTSSFISFSFSSLHRGERSESGLATTLAQQSSGLSAKRSKLHSSLHRCARVDEVREEQGRGKDQASKQKAGSLVVVEPINPCFPARNPASVPSYLISHAPPWTLLDAMHTAKVQKMAAQLRPRALQATAFSVASTSTSAAATPASTIAPLHQQRRTRFSTAARASIPIASISGARSRSTLSPLSHCQRQCRSRRVPPTAAVPMMSRKSVV